MVNFRDKTGQFSVGKYKKYSITDSKYHYNNITSSNEARWVIFEALSDSKVELDALSLSLNHSTMNDVKTKYFNNINIQPTFSSIEEFEQNLPSGYRIMVYDQVYFSYFYFNRQNILIKVAQSVFNFDEAG